MANKPTPRIHANLFYLFTRFHQFISVAPFATKNGFDVTCGCYPHGTDRGRGRAISRVADGLLIALIQQEAFEKVNRGRSCGRSRSTDCEVARGGCFVCFVSSKPCFQLQLLCKIISTLVRTQPHIVAKWPALPFDVEISIMKACISLFE